ncbi:Uncharacterised protein [Bordetella pertussis]|nr:Uncharacterised protein [Bordetella pertussis]
MPAAHATSQPPATRWLAEHALGFDYDMLPADARRIVRPAANPPSPPWSTMRSRKARAAPRR